MSHRINTSEYPCSIRPPLFSSLRLVESGAPSNFTPLPAPHMWRPTPEVVVEATHVERL